MNERTGEDRLRYAKQYGALLESFSSENCGIREGKVSELIQLKPDKRVHAMKALSNLAKFSGQYYKWLQLRQRYNLKWSTGNETLGTFEWFFDDSRTFDAMLAWLKKCQEDLPRPHSNFFLFCTLT
ncbi:MAG: hypothetical protein ACJ707_03350 [Nitrososphaera sp.]